MITDPNAPDFPDMESIANNRLELKVSTNIRKQFPDERGDILLDPDEVDLVLADMECLIRYIEFIKNNVIE